MKKKVHKTGGRGMPMAASYNQNHSARPPKVGMARLWELASIKKPLVIASCVLAVFSVAVSFTPFVAVFYIIRELAPHGVRGAPDRACLVRLGWLAAGGAVAAIALNFTALICSHIAAFTTLYKLKLDFTRHIASLPLGFHTGNSTGKLRKIVDENIEKLETFVAHQLPDLAGSFAMPVITLGVLFFFDWRLGLASFVPIVISYALQTLAYGNANAQVFIKKYQDGLEEMNNAAVEYVRGISVVKAFNQTIYSFRKFHETILNYGEFVMKYTFSWETVMVFFMLTVNYVFLFLMPVIILLSGGAADYAKFSAAAVFYLIFSVSLSTPFTKLMYVSQTGKLVADGIGRMDNVLDVRRLTETTEPKTAGEYSVSFENVSFSYADVEALSNISFTAKQGEITALAGPSGSGKTTIAHLIPRFYDVNEGAVKIGGVDIRDMENGYLMSLVSFVFQDVYLFKQSILDNIKIGSPNAERDAVIAAARAAQCHEFIEKLPSRYDTVIGAKNIHLSGGEKQRLVIARAILKNAPIIVLDEATAFADPENEQNIQRAFEELMKNKTVIIIAHRLSTVRGADKIVVIDKGRLAEEGRHDELVNSNGRYSRMWLQYTGALNWRIGAKNV
ncbi:MAG: ABC transporter ATP-binding protein/permease [Treponema sp.]|jgi:ATP-binding cassette subfamily B protein|nr:ABC transporter ATP-binding protein/permease [Treponema sp.]